MKIALLYIEVVRGEFQRVNTVRRVRTSLLIYCVYNIEKGVHF